MIMKLFEKYVEFLDTSIKKFYSEICTISSVIKAKMPKPKPKSTSRPNPTPPSPPKNHPTMKVIVEKPKKNTDYLDEIQKDIRRIEKSYDNTSQALTGTVWTQQPISGTYKPTVMSASISIDDYLKTMYKRPGNSVRRANRILGEDEPRSGGGKRKKVN